MIINDTQNNLCEYSPWLAGNRVISTQPAKVYGMIVRVSASSNVITLLNDTSTAGSNTVFISGSANFDNSFGRTYIFAIPIVMRTGATIVISGDQTTASTTIMYQKL